MGSYFLDTSAIVKRYVPAEQGHTWVAALCHPAQGHKLYISQAALQVGCRGRFIAPTADLSATMSIRYARSRTHHTH